MGAHENLFDLNILFPHLFFCSLEVSVSKSSTLRLWGTFRIKGKCHYKILAVGGITYHEMAAVPRINQKWAINNGYYYMGSPFSNSHQIKDCFGHRSSVHQCSYDTKNMDLITASPIMILTQDTKTSHHQSTEHIKGQSGYV